jgi:hypothetical protein
LEIDDYDDLFWRLMIMMIIQQLAVRVTNIMFYFALDIIIMTSEELGVLPVP